MHHQSLSRARALVVFSGGGMKGFAHIGVLRALRRMNVHVAAYAGTSVGAFIAAMAAVGMSVDDMETLACNVRQRDVLDFDWTGLMLRRFRQPGLYRGDRLADLIHRTLADRTYEQTATPLFVNAVDIAAGMNVIFGLPGLREFTLWETVMASCSIPGIFPPRKIRDRYFVDGAVSDNLQLRLARLIHADLMIAVNLQAFTVLEISKVARMGFVELMSRGDAITSHDLSEINFAQPVDMPRVLIHPDVSQHEVFGFKNNFELIAEGDRATSLALQRYEKERILSLIAAQADSDTKMMRLRPIGNPFVIDSDKCVRCGLCVINNPDGLFVSDGQGHPVYVDRTRPNTHDLAPLTECPFGAIRMDPELLKQMYPDDPPPHLARVAAGQTEFGKAIFPLPAPEADDEKREAV